MATAAAVQTGHKIPDLTDLLRIVTDHDKGVYQADTQYQLEWWSSSIYLSGYY